MDNRPFPETTRKKIAVALAEAYDDNDDFQTALNAILEYQACHDELRRSGTKLSDYTASTMVDRGAPMPDSLRSVLDEAQSTLGEVRTPGNSLSAI